MPKASNSSRAVGRTLFPSEQSASSAQTDEVNRGRKEKRCLRAFAVSATGAGFPFAQQAARLDRRIESPGKPAQEEVEYLITSRSAAQMNAQQMLARDRSYWGIENGLHLRLDVVAGEDRSRVRHRNAALNLAVIRRAVVSAAAHWIRRCQDRRRATLSGFYDWMSAQSNRKALKLVSTSKPLWLPDS